MKTIKRNRAAAAVLLGLIIINEAWAANEDCPAPPSCAPCGEVITNMPLPTYEACGVQPYQNYVATYESCLRGGLNGLYFGTGFGYGTINYDFSVPNIIVKDFSNSYITEYVTIGFAHSTSRFFIAGELGYYYDSLTSPVFYEDTSSLVFTTVGPPASTTTIIPCGVRLDINSQSHVAFDILPGFVVTQCLTLFGRLGFEYSSYTWLRRTCIPQAVVTTLDGTIVDADVNDFSFFGDFSDIGDKETDAVVDFRLGFGASYAVGQHLSFNINVVHIFGSKASFTPNTDLIVANAPQVVDFITGLPVTGTLTTNLTTLAAQNNIDPSRNEILFGLTLSF